jgi:cell fate regulator YaaT (PSP1 superfamily)
LSHLVEVAFKGNRKEFFLWDYPDPPPLNAAVIVDVDRGEDLGYVHALGELAQKRNGGCSHGCGTTLPERKALRLATEKDRNLSRELSAANEDARRKAMERVRANNLGMKLSDAEWQWDRKKLTLYFTADKRVDFRNLVRDLASLFRTRIELKQIGVRDEAKRLDGIGRCGRQYCSASWLPELRPVNLGVAKDQRLSLNPSQISGACGRLMCCLRYEHDFYVQSRKRFPKEGKIVPTSLGEAKVVSIDIFHESVTLRNVEGDTRTITLSEFKTETENITGTPATPFVEEEESVTEAIAPEEISPELMYTAEHQIPPRNNVVPELTGADTVANGNSGLRDGDGASRRRRGRRGGRRGRGGDDSSSGSA